MNNNGIDTSEFFESLVRGRNINKKTRDKPTSNDDKSIPNHDKFTSDKDDKLYESFVANYFLMVYILNRSFAKIMDTLDTDMLDKLDIFNEVCKFFSDVSNKISDLAEDKIYSVGVNSQIDINHNVYNYDNLIGLEKVCVFAKIVKKHIKIAKEEDKGGT